MKKKLRAITMGFLTLLLVSFFLSGNAAAAFPEKDINWIVPGPPGGGFDVYSRAVARVMPKYLPNKIDTIIKNIPGAGMRLGTNQIYRSEPNGYTIGILNIPGLIATQIVMETQYDVNKFVYLGLIYADPYGLAVPKDSPFRSIRDFQQAKKPVRFGGVGKGATTDMVSIIVSESLKIPYTFVQFKGSPQAILGAIRGDVDAVFFSVTPLAPYVRKGDLRAIAVLRPERSKILPDVPTLKELGYDGFLSNLASYRMVVAPPGTPKSIADVLEEAIKKACEDKEFLKWSKESDRPVDFASGEKSKGIIADFVKVLEKYKEMLK